MGEICEWKYRMGLIVKEVLNHDRDVIAFQEVNSMMFHDLDTELSKAGYTGVHAPSKTPTNTDTAVFWRLPLKAVAVEIGQVGEDLRNAIAVVFSCANDRKF